ncbi:MAG: hypothetical protein APR62_01095 [Smithella sp. SDB]|nr:MAG: hypothetical protein APR62_01095 [Smithella sp. SDB]
MKNAHLLCRAANRTARRMSIYASRFDFMRALHLSIFEHPLKNFLLYLLLLFIFECADEFDFRDDVSPKMQSLLKLASKIIIKLFKIDKVNYGLLLIDTYM